MLSQPIVGAILATNKWQTAVDVPQGVPNVTVNLRFVSLILASGTDVPIYVARVPAGDDPSGANYTPDPKYNIQPPGIKLGPNGSLAGIIEDSGIVIPAGYKIVVKTGDTTSGSLAVNYSGYTGADGV